MNSEIFDKIATVKHILEVSYPAVLDSRLLIRSMVILSEAYSFLAVEKEVSDEFLTKRDALISIVENYDLGPKSFSRPKDYVVCAKDYKVQVISVSSVGEYLAFLQENVKNLKDF